MYGRPLVEPPARRYDGIDVRHLRACRSREGGTCSCRPSYRAEAFDRRSGRKLRRTFPTLAAAKSWRSDAIRELRQGVRLGPTGITFRRAAEEWLAGAKDGTIRNRSGARFKPSALRGYEAALTSRLVPAIGGMRLEDVTRIVLQAFVDDLVGEELTASTIRNAVMPARAIFRRLMARGVVAVNPCTGLELPAQVGRRDRIASPEEALALLAALVVEADRTVWATALYAGLRAGEIAALDWSAVDLGGGTIAVERSYDAKAREFVAPKSRAGRRRVPIAAVLRDHLLEHKVNGSGEGLCFPRADGRPLDVYGLRTRARRAWEAAGVAPITLHECRHTFASLMIAAGVNAKALSTYLGHANIAITFDRYGHLMPGSEDQAAGLLDAYLERADTAARTAALGS